VVAVVVIGVVGLQVIRRNSIALVPVVIQAAVVARALPQPK
jgi:hypothetical protein